MFLNLVAPINQLGYGNVGFNVLKTLADEGHMVAYFPIGQPQWEAPVDFAQRALEAAKTFPPDAPSIRIWHQNDMAMMPGRGKRIGWPIFELNRFDMQEEHHLRSCDELFVCSEWAKEILKAEGFDMPIHVVPLGVDSSVFHVDEEAAAQRSYWTRDKTVFLNIGKWEVRKGHNELLEAFCKAFKPNDPVELWMINQNDFIGLQNEQWKLKYISSPMGQNIKIRPRVNTQAELKQIYNQVDLGVFPAHAEGWNLEVLELMACGKPSIVTNYSGHTEFCNEKNSFLVEPNGMESAQDGIWFKGQGEWCTFDVDELAKAMVEAHTARQQIDETEVYALKSQAALNTAGKFSWKNTVEKIECVL